MPPQSPHTALVLSAGGVRGAYQVGVLAGIVDVLGLPGAPGPPLFRTFTGSSVGALNAAYMAANADRRDHAIDGLMRVWRDLSVRDTLRPSPLALWGWPHLRLPGRFSRYAARRSPYVGRALFDPHPVERLIERVVAWDRLHANIGAGLVRALVIGALDICDGRTTLFAELAPGVHLRPWFGEERTYLATIDPRLVLASSALPFLYPARNIGGRYYMDGAVRFRTPIGPALRVDADRIVVISLLERSPAPPPPEAPEYPGFIYLLGKLASALLLDPVSQDIENLQRTNRMFEVIAEELDPQALAHATAALDAARDLPYRKVPTLVFRPSEDLARITNEFIHDGLGQSRIDPIRRTLFRWLARSAIGGQTELASILLLDGSLASPLIELGRRDAHAAEAEILAFFA